MDSAIIIRITINHMSMYLHHAVLRIPNAQFVP